MIYYLPFSYPGASFPCPTNLISVPFPYPLKTSTSTNALIIEVVLPSILIVILSYCNLLTVPIYNSSNVQLKFTLTSSKGAEVWSYCPPKAEPKIVPYTSSPRSTIQFVKNN